MTPHLRLTLVLALALPLALAGCSEDGAQPSPDGSPTKSAADGNSVDAGNTDARADHSGTPDTAAAGAQPGDQVSVHYVGKLPDGEVFDESRPKGRPLSFTVGAGEMIRGFDKAVRGMAVGDTKTVTLPPEDAYGQRNPQAVTTLQRTQLSDEINRQVKVGDQLGMQTSTGQMMPVTVTAMTDETITIDMNPKLAGKTLVFEIEMMSIRKADQ